LKVSAVLTVTTQ